MSAPRCTCEMPRGWPYDDGSDPGPCPYCEEMMWRDDNGTHDIDYQEMLERRNALTTLDDTL